VASKLSIVNYQLSITNYLSSLISTVFSDAIFK
jgi:hypothetical protein